MCVSRYVYSYTFSLLLQFEPTSIVIRNRSHKINNVTFYVKKRRMKLPENVIFFVILKCNS